MNQQMAEKSSRGALAFNVGAKGVICREAGGKSQIGHTVNNNQRHWSTIGTDQMCIYFLKPFPVSVMM